MLFMFRSVFLLQVTMATPAPVIAKVEADPSAVGISSAFDDYTGGTAENFVTPVLNLVQLCNTSALVDDVNFDMDSFVTCAALHSEVVATTVACDTNGTASNLAINCSAFSIADLYGNATEFSEQTYETFTDVDMSELCDALNTAWGMTVHPNSTIANTVEDPLVSPAHLDVVSEEQSENTTIILSGNGQELTSESVPVQVSELPCTEADSITVAHTAETSSPQTQGLRKLPLGPHPKLWKKCSQGAESPWIALHR